jgi:hypothetical protein
MSQRPATISDTIAREALFLWLLMLVIFSWILIESWGRVLNNIAFVTLKMDENSSYDTFILALTLTLIVFATIIFFKNMGFNYNSLFTVTPPTQSDDNKDGDSVDDYYQLQLPLPPPSHVTFFGFV